MATAVVSLCVWWCGVGTMPDGWDDHPWLAFNSDSESWSGSTSMDDTDDFWNTVTDSGSMSASSELVATGDSASGGLDDMGGAPGTGSLDYADAIGNWIAVRDSTNSVSSTEASAACDSGYESSGSGDDLLCAAGPGIAGVVTPATAARGLVQVQPEHMRGAGKRVKPTGRVLPATVGSTKRQRQCIHRGLEFEVAHRLLVGADPTTYPHRPDRLRLIQERQVFVERPPQRRTWGGGDRWRNSGGLRGGAIVWLSETHGVRKRYGTIIRGDGRPQLGFQHFSLVVRESGAADDAPITEDRSVYVYAVEGCAPEDLEEPLPPRPVKETRKARKKRSLQNKAARIKVESAAEKTSVSLAGSIPAAATGTAETRRVPAAGQHKVDQGNDAVATLDFAELPHQYIRMNFGAENLSTSDFKKSRKWPLGKATLAAVLSLTVVAMVGFLGLYWSTIFNTTPSDAVGCRVGYYSPQSDLLADCITCTNCAALRMVELLACMPDTDAVCGMNVDLAALLAIKATQAAEPTATWGGMAQWSADSSPCAEIDSQGTGWPGCQCDPVSERVVSLSVTAGVDITAPMELNLIRNLTALRYIGFYGKKAVYGDIQSLSSLMELRWLDLRDTSVYGLVSALASLIHIGECWEIHGGSPVGTGRCYPQYDGGLLLAGSHVHGSVSQLQALPGLGPTWRPDKAGQDSTSLDFMWQGSFSSCALFKGCGMLTTISDPAMYAGDDADACCISDTRTVTR